ncbi:MAG: glutathione synthase [Gammaproteobacteria bacterium]|nr:glutathione synthase [Gammaproteobacteria bacterium]NND39028.1 glutathione synthase [Pseudomonadales bacterium]
MSIKFGVVMDPIESINPKKDSTLAMLLAAQKRGWQLYYFTQTDLYKRGSEVRGVATTIKVQDDPANWFTFGEQCDLPLTELDVIFMRADPPVDARYIYTTMLLESAEREGSLVVNRPAALRDCNEKLFATEFAECCPPLLVSSDAVQLREFHKVQGDVILKPLDGMGGASIFRLPANDPNVNVVIEILTEHGSQLTMAQRFLPEIRDGDKRVLLIDGRPVEHMLARLPSGGETRGNLAAGGRGVARPLGKREREIAEAVAPSLVQRGIVFAGIDIIGDYLTEINVTSPTCIRELDAQCGLDIGGELMDAVQARLRANKAN